MVAGVPTIHFLIKRKQRKINNPQEVELIRRNLELTKRHQLLRSVQANFAEDFTGIEPFIGRKENEIALFNFQFLLQRRLLRIAEKLHDWRFPFTILHLDVGQPFSTETLGRFGHGFHLTLRHAGVALGVERLNHAAVSDDAAKHLEFTTAEIFSEIHNLHPKTRVGLINAPTVHHFLIRNARERRGHVVVERHFPNTLEKAFDQRVYIFPIYKRHLDIHLREFGLTIRTQILIAIATRELKIFIHA